MWKIFDKENLSLKPEDMSRSGAIQLPVVVFFNTRTGELRMFARELAERRGTDTILQELNLSLAGQAGQDAVS